MMLLTSADIRNTFCKKRDEDEQNEKTFVSQQDAVSSRPDFSVKRSIGFTGSTSRITGDVIRRSAVPGGRLGLVGSLHYRQLSDGADTVQQVS